MYLPAFILRVKTSSKKGNIIRVNIVSCGYGYILCTDTIHEASLCGLPHSIINRVSAPYNRFRHNRQNLAMYDCGFLEILRH